ncbi:TRAP transporter small permease [Falsiroseomonas sp. HW251]|uniref:TRAP transporter small permease n=1 Tax=Falsiroseomonas sp. HW251 TaxID=3390998 RepID=UPI003D312098
MEVDGEHGGYRPQGLIARLLWLASGILLLVITGLVLYATFARYFFAAAPIWSEDVPRVLFIWLTFLAAPVAILAGLNIRVGLVIERLPPRAAKASEVAMHLVVLAMLGVLFWWSLPILRLRWGGTMMTTGWTNAVFILPLTLGCVAMAAAQTVLLVKALRR